jgi:DNA-binding HxlR family transcriptional regulator
MAVVYEYVIHRFLRDRGGSASKKEIYRALGDDTAASRRMIDERLRMMERFGLVIIDGEEVKVKQKLPA